MLRCACFLQAYRGSYLGTHKDGRKREQPSGNGLAGMCAAATPRLQGRANAAFVAAISAPAIPASYGYIRARVGFRAAGNGSSSTWYAFLD